MTPRTGLRRRYGRNGEHGQMIVLFALCLMAIIAMAGLLIDGGSAWANRRQAQAAADTAALAAAKAIVTNNGVNPLQVAQAIANANGFQTATDCAGGPLSTVPWSASSGTGSGGGVTVNVGPRTGPHQNDKNFVEVLTTRKMMTTFAAAVGQGCWMVSARAVSSIGSSSVASCSFCSLNNTKNNHTILLQNGASLRVDGDIYTNSWSGCVSSGPAGNGLTQCNDNATCAMKDWKACGDGFDVFGTPPTPPAYISAKTISVVGGWETHDQNIVIADSRQAPPDPPPPDPRPVCPNSPTPQEQLNADPRASNVCIHMPPIVDPFAGVTAPVASDYTVPTATSCTAAAGTSGVKPGSATAVTSITSGIWTLCPGKYYGISITGATTKAVMRSGVYYLTNKGFVVTSGGSVDGSAGVMIYNAQSGSNGVINISQLEAGADIAPNPDWTAENPSFPGFPGAPLPSVTLTNGTTRTVPTAPTYAFKVNQVGTAKLSGEVHFYDGPTELSSGTAGNCPVVTKVLSGNFTANCKVNWGTADVGTHGIAAVFYSSANTYDNVEKIQSPREILREAGVSGGTTALKAMSSGPYQGFVIWQGKTSNVNMVISPQSALPSCSGSWMTDGIPNTAPPPCGDLGGIQGTIYAGGPTAQVQVTANGLADVQIVAGRILVTSGVDARFAFTPSAFALGGIGLVE